MTIQNSLKTTRQSDTLYKKQPIDAEQTSPLSRSGAAHNKLMHIVESIQSDNAEDAFSKIHLRPRRNISELLRWYIVSDIMALLIGFISAWAFSSFVNSFFYGRAISNPWIYGSGYATQFGLISIGVLLWFEHAGHYRCRMPFWLEMKKVTTTLGCAMMADSFIQFASKQDSSRLLLVSGWGVTAVFIILVRGILRTKWQKQGVWQVRTLLVGGGATATDASAALKSEKNLGYEITAQIRHLPFVFQKNNQTWENICQQYNVDYILIALDGEDLARAEKPLAQLMREQVPFSVSPPLRHLPVFGMEPHYFFNHDVMLLTRTSGLEQPLPRLLKRLFDIIASGFAIILLSPVFLLITLLVKLDGGVAFFPNRRLGMNGKVFNCLKFRSMVNNSDKVLNEYLSVAESHVVAEWQSHKKLRGHDPRVTKIGRTLRKLSLDELPQLFNVFFGQMSLVGPRPILLRELDEYNHDIAHYYRVRPGITGLWQVSGRNEVSYATRIQMDSWYVRNWSLWHDIAILCKTIPVLLNRTGAY